MKRGVMYLSGVAGIILMLFLFACSGGSSTNTNPGAQGRTDISGSAEKRDNGSIAEKKVIPIPNTPNAFVASQWGRRTRRLPLGTTANSTNATANMNAATASAGADNNPAKIVPDQTSVSGTASQTAAAQSPLFGTWGNKGHTLVFNSDNTYTGDMNKTGVPGFSGILELSGNVIILTDTGGIHSCSQGDGSGATRGLYTYTVNGNELTFSPVQDLCKNRMALLKLTYKKQ